MLRQRATIPVDGTALATHPTASLWACARGRRVSLVGGDERRATLTLPSRAHDVRFSGDGRLLLVAPHLVELATEQVVELPATLSETLNGITSHFELTAAAYRPPAGLKTIEHPHTPSEPAVQVLLLNGRTRALARTLMTRQLGRFATAAVSQDRLAVADTSVHLWPRDGAGVGAVILPKKPRGKTLRALRFNRDGSALAGIDARGAATVWTFGRGGAGEVVAQWEAHDNDGRAVAFHPERPLLATGARDSALKLWALDRLRERVPTLLAAIDTAGPVEGLAWSSRGESMLAAVGGRRGQVVRFGV